MYQVQESSTPDGKFQPNLFSTADEKWHSFVLKPIGSFFTASSILSLEELLDRSINDFIQILTDRFADKKISCDMADYIMFCKWHACSVACCNPDPFSPTRFSRVGLDGLCDVW